MFPCWQTLGILLASQLKDEVLQSNLIILSVYGGKETEKWNQIDELYRLNVTFLIFCNIP